MPTKRVTITAFLRDYFEEGSAPTRRTVLNWIRDGIIQGEQIGKPGKDGKRGGQCTYSPIHSTRQNQSTQNGPHSLQNLKRRQIIMPMAGRVIQGTVNIQTGSIRQTKRTAAG